MDSCKRQAPKASKIPKTKMTIIKIPRKSTSAKTKRTPGPYALFVKSLKGSFKGDLRTFSSATASKWRSLGQAEKESFAREAKSLQAKSNSPCKQSACSVYLRFYKAAYTCIRQQNPDWTSKQVKEEVMRSYHARKCPCD